MSDRSHDVAVALLDRFRTLSSPHKHQDPAIRLAYVDALPIADRDEIARFAREDDDPQVRRAAAAKLLVPSTLSSVARDDPDQVVREQAVEMLRDIALDRFEGLSEPDNLAAVEALAVLNDAKTLATIAKSAAHEGVAQAARAAVTDGRLQGSIARHASLEAVRRAALDALHDHEEVVTVAMHSEFRDTALAALEQVSSRPDLERIAGRARNKSAAKRARTALREMDEREAAAAEPPPAALVTNAELECLQIVQQLEAIKSAEAPDTVEAALCQAEVAWASVGGSAAAAVEARFAVAVALVRERLAEARTRAAEWARSGEAKREEGRAREELIDRVHGLTGRSALEGLEAAREEWSRLKPLAGSASATVIEERFAQAARTCERRYAVWQGRERVRARLAELVAEAESAARDPELASARKRIALAHLEWADRAGDAETEPADAERFAAAERRIAQRDAERRDAEARMRHEALMRLQQLTSRVDLLLANADLPLKAGERALHDLRAALSDVPPLLSKGDHDEIVRRLKAAQAALTVRVQDLRQARDWKRFANLGAQEQLCVRMEALRAVDAPEDVVRQVRELQREWRQVANAPRALGEPLWRRFKAAHDEVWARCEAHLAREAEERATNLAAKISLCERVEALAGSTSWIQTADEIKRLQAEWKTIGPLPPGQERTVWERFRAAGNTFFTRRHQDLVQRKAMWAGNLAKKEALCARAETLVESSDWNAAAAEMRHLQAEWKTIGPVKRTRSEAIWQRFRTAGDRFFAGYAHRHDAARAEHVAVREAICTDLEALAPVDNLAKEPPAGLIATVRTICSRWEREVAGRGIDREQAATLHHRFHAAFDRVSAAWPAVFAGTDLDLEANRKRMETLVKRMEDLAASLGHGGANRGDEALSPTTRLAAMLREALASNTIGGKVDEEARLRAARDDVRQAQASWARIGPVADGVRRSLSGRFERACRRVMELLAARPAGPGGSHVG